MKMEMKDIMREEFRNVFTEEMESAVKGEVEKSLSTIIPPIRGHIDELD